MKQILALSRARKSYDGKVVLDDVTLGFLPGAKIGVLGPNGTGKSTLLRLMAGLEQLSDGEVVFAPGCIRGILVQEPVLDEGKTVLGNVEGGVAGARAVLERYTEVAAELAAGYSDDLLDELGRLQEKLDHLQGWGLDSRVEQAMDALRCPPPDSEVSVLSGGERRPPVVASDANSLLLAVFAVITFYLAIASLPLTARTGATAGRRLPATRSCASASLQ